MSEKNIVIFIGVIICFILMFYGVIWSVCGFYFPPLVIGTVICLIIAVCIIKCCKDRIREIKEEKDVISKY